MTMPLPHASSRFAVRGRAYPREAPAPRRSAPRRLPRWPLAAMVALLLALAAWQLAGAAWIHAKATLAQHLIAAAWERTRTRGETPPWPWADTYPVARLAVPAHGVSLYVLAGASGRSLAFGPGLVAGTALPGSAGNSVIVAHRDTHFAFLRQLREDEAIDVEDARGRRSRYRVRGMSVVGMHDTQVLAAEDTSRLTLVTCWPFQALHAGSTQRYVVVAERVDA